MANPNNHGLTRPIPAAVQQEVRRRCGFGCIICGVCFYDYEHFDPKYCDASEHKPQGITLLCMQCNQKRERGLLSLETVIRCNANPRCLQQGFSREWLDFGSHPVRIALGGSSFTWGAVLTVAGDPILAVNKPALPGQPWLLSVKLADSHGRIAIEIQDNNLIAHSSSWDVKIKGSRIIVRERSRKRCLVLKMVPPTEIIFESLDMAWKGRLIKADSEILKIKHPNSAGWFRFSHIAVQSNHGMGGMNF